MLSLAVAMAGQVAQAASCTTQSQMTAAQRDTLSTAAKAMLTQMQGGNVQALQANTIPAVAADFSGIAASVQSLKPLIQNAALTVTNVYYWMRLRRRQPLRTARHQRNFFADSQLFRSTSTTCRREVTLSQSGMRPEWLSRNRSL